MRCELLRTHPLSTGAVVSLLISLLIVVIEAQPFNEAIYDFIVIGGGSDGSIVAKRLSENPNWTVLVLESANYGSAPDFYSVELTNKNLAHQLRCPRLSQRIAKHYVRGVPEDYDLWLQSGNDGWGFEDVLPYFQKSVGEAGSAYMPESYVVLNESESISQDHHDVEQMVISASGRSKSLRLLHTAETGMCVLPYTEVSNRDVFDRRSNLYMIRGAEPKQINFDRTKQRVSSVKIVYNGIEITITVKKELVLAADAIDSAKLLMLSGIGTKEHLNSLNILVVHDLPVGQNLQDHLTLPIFFTTPNLDVLDLSLEETKKILPESKRRGPFEDQGMLSLTEFVNTLPRKNSKTPDIEYHYFFIKHHDYATLGNWNKSAVLDWEFYNNLENILLTKNLLIIQAVLVHPKSSGSVELRSISYADSPKISPNYLDNTEDVETLLRSIHHVENKLQKPSFRDVELLKIPNSECYKEPRRTIEDDFYWRCYMRYMAMPQFNYVGTVKMGPSKTESCVNSRLLVHGLKNLRVADASIMPDIPSSEINAAALMIAEKAADLIKTDWE